MARIHRTVFAPAALLALLLAGCAEDLALPSTAKISCTDECPEGWTCNPRLGRCIRNDAIDTVPPALVGAPVVTPADAPLGSRVTVSFDVNEPLHAPPSVALDAGARRVLTLDAAASAGNHWVYAWDTAGDEPQGRDCPITLSLEDLQGLESVGLAAGSVRFDFIPPGLSGPLLTGSPAGFGAVLELSFNVSEPLAAAPVVHLGSSLSFVQVPAAGGFAYTFQYVSDGTEPEGAAFPVTVDLADAAGHETAAVAAGTAIFDRTSPALVAVPTVTPAAAADGVLVRVTFEVTEPLDHDPVVLLGAIALDKGSQVGNTWSYGHVAVAADGEGTRALSIDLTDLAGNGSGAIPGPPVTFDFSTPAVSDLRVCLDDATPAPCAADRDVYSAASGGNAMKITFTLSEPAEQLDVTVGATSLIAEGACASADGLSWRCSTMVTDPLGGSSPRVETDTVAIAAIDAAGNSSFDYRWITYDFQPPSLAGTPYFERCDGYAPARVAPNDLWVKRVTAFAGSACPFTGCGLTGPVRVHFTVDENVAFSGAGVTLDDGTPLQIDTCASGGTQFVAVLTGDGTAGTRPVRADVLDAGGNPRQLALGTLRLDYSAPAAPDTGTAGRIVYDRFPWGARATGGARKYFLRGEANAVAAGASVVVLDQSNPAVASEIGRAGADGAGAFGGAAGSALAFEVVSANLPEIYVAQEDAAGNASSASPVWDGAWTASLGGKQRGNTTTNPNRILEQPLWRPFRDTGAQREPADPAALAAGTARLTTAAQPGFERQWTLAGTPHERGGCSMTWDPARAQGILFGGFWSVYGSAPVYSDETWLWNGRSWVAPSLPVRPQGRWGHGLAQDEARDRTVLFGGCTAGPGTCTQAIGDTWEFDGQEWRRVCWPGCSSPSECTCTQSPPARTDAAFFWDHLNGELVLFGGATPSAALGDMWAWDGTDWRFRTPANLPPAGAGALVASDPIAGTAMIVASSTSTWIWNGLDWTGHTTASDSPSSGQIWFDAAAGKYRGHFSATGRLHEWTGTDWTLLSASVPVVGDGTMLQAAKWTACGTYDTERSAWIRFGGCAVDFCREDLSTSNATFAFRTDAGGNHAFVQLFPGNSPDVRLAPAMAWSPSTLTAWLHGGAATSRYSYDDDWQWDGFGWLGTRVVAGIGGANSQAMCRLGADRLVRYGGTGYGFPGGPPIFTWGWYAGSWSRWMGSDYSLYVEPVETGSMIDQSMAWDEARSEAIFFRGDLGGATTWTAVWNDNLFPPTSGSVAGVDWRAKAPTAWPTSVRGHRIAYCAGAGGAILFGGYDGTNPLAETWSWSGANWTRLSPAQSPPAREQHVMFCDPLRGKTIVVGGTGVGGVLDDVWEFDGVTWRLRAPLERPSARRGAGAAFHEPSGRGILFGGYGTEHLGDTWIWDGGRDARPAQIFRAAFGAAGVWSDAAIQGVDARFTSGGSGGGVNGAALAIWDRGQWRPAAAGNGASSAAPAALAWSTGSSPEWSSLPAAQREARLRRLFAGDAQELSIAAAPVGTNQTFANMASLATDSVELAVRYRLRCRSAGSQASDPARCCSGAATAGICQ